MNFNIMTPLELHLLLDVHTGTRTRRSHLALRGSPVHVQALDRFVHMGVILIRDDFYSLSETGENLMRKILNSMKSRPLTEQACRHQFEEYAKTEKLSLKTYKIGNVDVYSSIHTAGVWGGWRAAKMEGL